MEKSYFSHMQVSMCIVLWCVIQLGFPWFSNLQCVLRLGSRFFTCFVLFCFFPFPLASDATRIFEETKHSVEAREMMQAFFVGIFVEVREYPVLLCHIISRKQSPSRLTF